MPNPEDEFQQFREDLENRQVLEAEFNAAIERFDAFLVERGVDTDLSQAKIDIATVATSKLMMDEIILQKPENPDILNIKKELQAHYFLLDYDQAWQELIDKEFPGEPLTPEDTDIIASEFSKLLTQTEKYNLIFDQSKSAMLGYLGQYQGFSIEDMSDEDHIAIHYLVFLQSNPHMPPHDKFERAREALLKRGYLGEPAWDSLLHEFFPVEEI